MPDGRPQVPARPCPRCGQPVDPLRAREVVLLDDGFRFLCDLECREGFAKGDRAHDRVAARSPAGHRVRKDPSTGRLRTRDLSGLPPLSHAHGHAHAQPGAPGSVPALGLGAGLMAVAFGLLSIASPWLGLISALLTLLSAADAWWTGRASHKRSGLLTWTLGPVGVGLASVSGLLLRVEDESGWVPLVGAAVAALAMVARSWLDATSRSPLTAACERLTQTLPSIVRVPVTDQSAPTEVSFVEKPAEQLRAGEEVLVVEGGTVPVDGVVQVGEAEIRLFPGAGAAEHRSPGGAVLAGARVEKGAIRVLASRVGNDRAIMRPVHLARSGSKMARVSGISERVTRFGSWGVAALAVAAPLGLSASDWPSWLAASAAILLAAPLLAIRTAGELPAMAALSAAVRRGIVFRDAVALEDAGRVTVVALGTRGTATEGTLEVVEVHAIGDARPEPLIALAAGAETAAEGHPIARSIHSYAETQGISPETARRATFILGRGITALAPNGEPLVVGSRRLLLDEGISVAVADREASGAEARGYTALFIGLSGRVRAVLALQDAPRAGARAAVQRMMDLGIEVVLLSGDHRTTVESLASYLDVDNIRAELLPEERGAEVRRLAESGGFVCSVGRLLHDDDALDAAHVPIALCAAGGPGGERGVALATDDVRDAAAALWIARAARTQAARAVLLSSAAGLVLVGGALALVLSPWAAALLAVAVDAFALPSGARLMRRIDLRLPTRE